MTQTYSPADTASHDPVDPTAVMGRRIFAWIIDVAIIAAIVSAFVAVRAVTQADTIDFATNAEAEAHCDTLIDQGEICFVSGADVVVLDFGGSAFVLLGLALSVVLTMLLPGLTGWSLGKLILGLRIVNKETFAHAGMWPNIVRGLLWIVDSIPYVVVIPLVGLITGLATKGHRRVGDMAAKTLVVRKEHVGRPLDVPGVNQVAAREHAAAGLARLMADDSEQPVMLGHFDDDEADDRESDEDAEASAEDHSAGSPDVPEPQARVEAGAHEAGEHEAGAAPEDSAQPDSGADEDPGEPEGEPGADDGAEDEVAADDAEAMPGVGAPHFDEARDTYIQWDPELEEWMEWSTSANRWVPISR